MKHIVLLLIVGALSAALLTALVQQRKEAHAFFSQELAEVRTLEQVRVGNVLYTVSEGVITSYGNGRTLDRDDVLRLAYAKAVIRRDTPLAFPTSDLDTLEKAIAALEDAQTALAELQQTARERQIVGSSLFPVQFLRSALEAERSRRAFLESGDDATLLRYLRDEAQALRVYDRSAQRFRRAFSEAIPESFTREFITADTALNRSAVIEFFLRLENRILEQERAHSRFVKCTRGIVAFCDTELAASSTAENRVNAPVSAVEPSLAREVRKAFGEAGWPEVHSGLLVALPAAACLPEHEARPLFVLAQKGEMAGRSFLESFFVGDIRFVQERGQHDPFSVFLTQNGAGLLYSNPFNHYQCLRSGSDYGDVLAAGAVHSLAQDALLSGYAREEDRGVLHAVETLERESDAVLSADDAFSYLRIARTLAEEGQLPPALAERIISLDTAVSRGVVGFEHLAYKIAYAEHNNIRFAKERDVAINFSAPRLFLTESAFFGLFFAETMFSEAELSRFFPYHRFSAAEQPYVWYSQLSDAAKQDALEDLEIYARAYGR